MYLPAARVATRKGVRRAAPRCSPATLPLAGRAPTPELAPPPHTRRPGRSPGGRRGYPNAVEYAFGARVDYAQVVKEFGSEGGEEARRYAPPRLIGQEKITVSGSPDEEKISTSHVERANWTLRGHLRRFTRLSNGFSRKKANLRAALALYFAYYNFCRMHKSIRMTPAMAAGIARKPWTLADLLEASRAA